MACIDVNPKGGSTDKGKGFKERIIPSEGVLHTRKRRKKKLYGGWGQVFTTKLNDLMVLR